MTMPDNVDPVVPTAVENAMRQNAEGSASLCVVLRNWLITILLIIITAVSATNFVLTQRYNHCQSVATQRLRDASSSDRAAQDTLDDRLLAPGKRVTTREAADEVYRQFKATRAANDAKRANTTERC